MTELIDFWCFLVKSISETIFRTLRSDNFTKFYTFLRVISFVMKNFGKLKAIRNSKSYIGHFNLFYVKVMIGSKKVRKFSEYPATSRNSTFFWRVSAIGWNIEYIITIFLHQGAKFIKTYCLWENLTNPRNSSFSEDLQ